MWRDFVLQMVMIQWACVRYVLSLMTESALRLMTEYCVRYPDNIPSDMISTIALSDIYLFVSTLFIKKKSLAL